MNHTEQIDTVLQILTDEVKGDVASALAKMTEDYHMTWVYKDQDTLFPSTGIDVEAEMREVYTIEDREYHVMHIAEGENVVMVELIETYTDPQTEEVHTTPLVLVLEFDGQKLTTGRHYCDPRLSHESLSVSYIKNTLFAQEAVRVINKTNK